MQLCATEEDTLIRLFQEVLGAHSYANLDVCKFL